MSAKVDNIGFVGSGNGKFWYQEAPSLLGLHDLPRERFQDLSDYILGRTLLYGSDLQVVILTNNREDDFQEANAITECLMLRSSPLKDHLSKKPIDIKRELVSPERVDAVALGYGVTRDSPIRPVLCGFFYAIKDYDGEIAAPAYFEPLNGHANANVDAGVRNRPRFAVWRSRLFSGSRFSV